jgi:hypothetical protein
MSWGFVAAFGSILLFATMANSQTLDDAPSLRCGVETVSVGDTLYAVGEACGTPDRISISNAGTVEKWIYNFGSKAFIRYLTFVNGHLDRIQVGEPGTVER